MEQTLHVKDLMEDIFEYPHMPYWFTLRQAVDIMRKMAGPQHGAVEPVTILIFDERYNLLGALDMKSVLLGLVGPPAEPQGDSETPDDETPAKRIASEDILEKPVSAFMRPIQCFLDPDDQVGTAAAIMIRNELTHVPVLEGKKKLLGIVKMTRVFGRMTDELFK